MMKNKTLLVAISIVLTVLWSCTSKQVKMENRLKKFISEYEAKSIPLYKEMTLSSWNANVTGTDIDYAKSEKASFDYAKIFTDKGSFTELKEIRDAGEIKDPLLARQLDLLYNSYLGGQVDTTLIAEQIKMETEISKKYSNFRVNIKGKPLSDNEVDDILRNSLNSTDLQTVWEGSKMIGPLVADDIIKLVKHRNNIAKKNRF